MTRSTLYVESAAGLAVGDPIANVKPGGSYGFKLRRLLIGIVNPSGSIVDTTSSVGVGYATLPGTATSTLTFSSLDFEYVGNAAGITADVAWSTNPTFSTSPGQAYYVIPVSTGDPADFTLAEDEAVGLTSNYTNGLVLFNVGAALPANHVYTLTIEVEE